MRIYFNYREAAPMVWSVDDGNQETEQHYSAIHMHGVITETRFDPQAGKGKPSAWLYVCESAVMCFNNRESELTILSRHTYDPGQRALTLLQDMPPKVQSKTGLPICKHCGIRMDIDQPHQSWCPASTVNQAAMDELHLLAIKLEGLTDKSSQDPRSLSWHSYIHETINAIAAFYQQPKADQRKAIPYDRDRDNPLPGKI